MTQDAALVALTDLVAALSGFTASGQVLISEDGAPRGDTPHITTTVVSDVTLGWTVIDGTDAEERRQMRVQVDAWGGTACTALLRAASLLRSPDPRNTASGVAIQRVDPVRRTTVEVAGRWEQRRTVEVWAGYILTTADAQSPSEVTRVIVDTQSADGTLDTGTIAVDV